MQKPVLILFQVSTIKPQNQPAQKLSFTHKQQFLKKVQNIYLIENLIKNETCRMESATANI